MIASVQENEGLYLPIYEVVGLPGATYDLIADEDIYTGDGTLRVAKDTVVETLTTGEDSTATSGLLYLGRYRLEERHSPAGMVLDTEPVYTEISYAGQTVEVTQVALGLYDERQKVSIDLYKSLETDERFHIGLEEEYKDISFGLYASEDIAALDGSVIPAGGLLEVVSVSPVEDAPGQYYANLRRMCLSAASMCRNILQTRHLSCPISSTRLCLSMPGRKSAQSPSRPTTAMRLKISLSVGV